MRIEDVLAEVDETKPSQYDDSLKIQWISRLEGKIYQDVYLTHESDREWEFSGYTQDDMCAELFVDDTYADLYKYYLFAMIDFHNQEIDRYNNAMIMFNASLDDFKAYYNRTHMPKSKPYRIL